MKSSLSISRVKPQNLRDVQTKLYEWQNKIQKADLVIWSDSIREKELREYVSHTDQLITQSHLRDFELSLHYKRRENELLKKSTSRKRLKVDLVDEVLELIREIALEVIVERKKKSWDDEEERTC